MKSSRIWIEAGTVLIGDAERGSRDGFLKRVPGNKSLKNSVGEK